MKKHILTVTFFLIFNLAAVAQVVTGTISIGAGSEWATINKTTNRIYCSEFGSTNVAVIDGNADTLLVNIPLGASSGYGIAANATTNRIYVADNSGNARLIVINGATNTVLTPITLSGSPYGVAVNESTNQIYVTDGSSSLFVINGSTNAVTTVSVGNGVRNLAINPVTNRVYVSNYNDNSISVVNTTTNTLVTTIPSCGGGFIAVNTNTNKIYSTLSGGNKVNVIDGSTNTVTTTVNVGNNTEGIDVNTTTNRVYVANRDDNSVSIIDGSTNIVIGSPVTVGTYPVGLAVNPVTNRIYTTNEGNYTVSSINANLTLPVELSSFTAKAIPTAVQLIWTTATEKNNAGFSIERSSDAKTFATIGFLKGFGTTTEPKTYNFTDRNASGKVTYRLKQIDFDGKYEYSKTVEAEAATPKAFSLEQNYPNPFNPTTNVGYVIPLTSAVTLRVYDVLGREVATLVNTTQSAGRYEVAFEASKFASGVYFYRLQAGNFSEMKKMLLVK
jgi:YVTN family beta-propeller protein